MRREIPVIITIVVGFMFLLNNLVTVQIGDMTLALAVRELSTWVTIVSAFAVGLASVNLMRIHARNVSRQRDRWWLSVVLVATFVLFTVVGVLARTYNVTWAVQFNQKLFDHIQTPLGSAMFSIIAFYIASAAYRAFRMRSLEASILLASAILLMLGRAPIGEVIWRQFPPIANWLMDIPNNAGQRAVLIGAAIGGFATALRVLIGMERGHLGGE